jgi:outer membrane protein TolC
VAQGEKERLTVAQTSTLDNLKAFLGLKPTLGVTMNLKEVKRQVFGQFEPAAASLDQTKSRSYELKMLEIKKRLQEFNILLAKTKLLPTVQFGVTMPDPLSSTVARGFYVFGGLEVPVWDGFKRLRNISRQKTLLRQYGSEKQSKEVDLGGKFQGFVEEVRAAALARKLALSQEELARLKERQAEIHYQSGGEPLTVFLEARKAALEAQKNAILKSLDYDLAVLALRQFTGDLSYTYVQVRSWQN